MRFSTLLKCGVAAAAASLALPAQAAVLDFSGNICGGGGVCGNYSSIDQTYGDIAGQLDVIYYRNTSIPGISSLSWWSDYSSSLGVAWGDSGSTSEIFLSPLAGFSVTLNSLFLGSYQNVDRRSQLTILDGLGNSLFASGAITVGATGASYNFLNYTSANGYKIQWGPDAFDVGIDNINFTVQATQTNGAVPEPSTWAMMLLGFGAVGAAMRRRQQVQLRYA